MGFEPTTASLEGWNSTTELRPPFLYFPRSNFHHTKNSLVASGLSTCKFADPRKRDLVGRQGFEPWKT